jgi:hypothetical protein
MFGVRPGSEAERHRRGTTTIVLALAASSLAIACPASASRSLIIRDEGRLGFIKSSASQLIDEGRVAGTVPGVARVRFTYNGNPAVAAQFTIYGRYGTISGRATGRLSNPTSTTPSLRGSASITAGSGRYARASGSGELFGVFYRRGYGLTVQAVVTMRY